jgi:hypothetical protein
MDWIDLAEVSEQWWAAVEKVMNIRVSKNIGKFVSS